jgi:hypothetical protein
MTGIRRSGLTGAGQRRPRIAVLLTALLAAFLQAFVVQTHIHAYAPLSGAAGYEQSAQADDHGQHATAAHDQRICSICATLAASGNGALPDAVTLVAEHTTTHDAAALHIRAPPAAPLPPWQSRAPPIAL